MNENKYPTPYEVKEVFNNFLKRGFIDSFSKSLGIFFFNATQEDVATNLSKVLFDKADIDYLRTNAYQTTLKHALSGFTIKSLNDKFSLKELYERIRDTDAKVLESGYKLNSLTKTQRDSNEPTYKGSIDYKKKKPGRIEFLDEEKGYSEFYFIDKGNGEWQVEVDGNKSADGKEVMNLIKKFTFREAEISEIRIDYLKNQTNIDFFDELAKIGLGDDWQFTSVMQLTIKRIKQEDLDVDGFDESENEELIEKEQLTGINQAILEGRNLRDDPFVLNYEKEGFIFSAMTYEFEAIHEPETIQIRAEFKGSPKIFEVSIISFKKSIGIEIRKENVPLTSDRHRELRSIFWNNAKNTYTQLLQISSPNQKTVN